jgi:hypothetical protein
MSAAADVYIPACWDTSVEKVLSAEGFSVTVRARKFAKGVTGREYLCLRGNETVSFTEGPIPEDTFFLFLLGISRPKHAAVLLSARDALIRYGALDDDTYKTQRRKA